MCDMLETGVFWYGDNLDVMREDLTSDGEVDLIYLDPPFNSGAGYNMFFREADKSISQAQRRVFEDYWTWGKEAQVAFDQCIAPRRKYLVSAAFVETMQALSRIIPESDMLAYLSMMAVRLIEMKRLMKPTGSIYLHCDPTASHYLKLIMDALFGPTMFRNEVIWKRTGSHNSTESFGPVHDVILFYSRTEDAKCHPDARLHSAKYLQHFGKIDPKTGKNFQDVTLTGPGIRQGPSGQPWRGIDPAATRPRHWQPASYVYEKYKAMTGDDLANYELLERFDKMDEVGLIYWTKNGQPRYKLFLEDAEGAGAPAQDVWTDIPPINSQADEATGYPTQKPMDLLERIISASSEPGQIVLDPFCGCGTAVLAAQKLGRRWIGIDVTHLAVSVLKGRMDKRFPGVAFRVRGEPADPASARDLAARKPLEFQAWIVDKVGGVPIAPGKEKGVAKGGGDDGRDGFIKFRDDPKATDSRVMLLSAKGGESYTTKPEIVDTLRGTMTRYGATLGAVLMSHKPSDGTYRRALVVSRVFPTRGSHARARRSPTALSH